MPYSPESIDSIKFWADYFKHLTTIATGTLLLISGFLEKLLPHPYWKPVVVLALLGFLACILGSVLALSGFVMASGSWEDDPDKHDWVKGIPGRFARVGLFMCWIGFLVGMVAFTAFTIRNLL